MGELNFPNLVLAVNAGKTSVFGHPSEDLAPVVGLEPKQSAYVPRDLIWSSSGKGGVVQISVTNEITFKPAKNKAG